MLLTQVGSVPGMGSTGTPGDGKSYTVEQNARIRAAARRLLDERYEGNRTALAKDLGVTQSAVSGLLNEVSGAGVKMAAALARLCGVSVSELSDGVPSGSNADTPMLGQRDGYAEAEAEAKKLTALPDWLFTQTRRIQNLMAPNPITTEFLVQQALLVWRHLPEDEKIRRDREADMAQAKRIMTAGENKARKRRKAGA